MNIEFVQRLRMSAESRSMVRIKQEMLALCFLHNYMVGEKSVRKQSATNETTKQIRREIKLAPESAVRMSLDEVER
jgi:hypothetical protein